MRILLVTGSFPPMRCGVGDYTSMLAAALGRRGDSEVAVLTHVLGRRPDSMDRFDLLTVADGWRVSEIFRILRVVRSRSPDIIHFQFPGQGYGPLQWLLPAVFRTMGFRVFLTLHEYFAVSGFQSFLSAMLNLPNLCVAKGIVVTRGNYQDLVPSVYSKILRGKAVCHIPIGTNIPTVQVNDREREEIRNRYGTKTTPLLSYFGFVSPQKGVEDIFRIADPACHRIVLICSLRECDPLHKHLLDVIENPPWKNRVRITGFLPVAEVGRIMAASDAVVLPFRNGGSIGNSTLHGAIAQGTFALTTSLERVGYDPGMNAYFARPGNIEEMSTALATYSGVRIPREEGYEQRTWDMIAEEHMRFYRSTSGSAV